MKKYITLLAGFVFIISICLGISNTTAQEVPDLELPVIERELPPQLTVLQSPDLLRLAALRSVVKGERHVSSKSIDKNWDMSVTSMEVTGTCAEEVLHTLFEQDLVYRVTNPNGKIVGQVSLSDENDNILFSGFGVYTYKSLKAQKPLYRVWLQSVPILEEAVAAEVLSLLEDGNTANRFQLQVKNGQVVFPPHMAGSPNGLLVVQLRDGTLNTYELWNPIQREGQVASSSGDYMIEGHHVVNNIKDVSTVEIVAIHHRPTVYFQETGEVILNVKGIYTDEYGETKYELPNYVIVDHWPKAERIPITGREIRMFVFKGTRIWFEWNVFGKPSTLYTGPIVDGKG